MSWTPAGWTSSSERLKIGRQVPRPQGRRRSPTPGMRRRRTDAPLPPFASSPAQLITTVVLDVNPTVQCKPVRRMGGVCDGAAGRVRWGGSCWWTSTVRVRVALPVNGSRGVAEAALRNMSSWVCPQCGSPMVRRYRRADGRPFWGCVRYPACRGVRGARLTATARQTRVPDATSAAGAQSSTTVGRTWTWLIIPLLLIAAVAWSQAGSRGGGPGLSSGTSRPAILAATIAPAYGPTARCRDGTYSYSANHSGTCSHHGGVATWYR